VLIEVHHLKSFELFRDFMDFLVLTRLDNLHAWCIPIRTSLNVKIGEVTNHLIYLDILLSRIGIC
jgi:hypothetical protein